jgi:hypothetical protein
MRHVEYRNKRREIITVISVNSFMFPDGYIYVSCKEPNNMSKVPLSSIYVKICTVFVHSTVHHLIKYFM